MLTLQSRQRTAAYHRSRPDAHRQHRRDVAQTVLSEVGLDRSRWNTKAHFSSWLGLCPDDRISGDKLLGKGMRHVVNRAATALRLAARNLIRSRSYLGAQ